MIHQLYFTTALAALASAQSFTTLAHPTTRPFTTAAAPTTLPSAGTPNAVVTYNCNTGHNACLDDVAAGKQSSLICKSEFTACQSCATQEHSCRVGAGSSYQAQTKCTVAAQICYEMALSPGSAANGYYTCKEAFDSCSSAPDANHSLCASQKSACLDCAEKENKCRNAPGANQSLCSSGAGGCFERAMSFGGEL